MSQESRSRAKDFWQLHVPLVLVLALCTVATIIEARRASEGVDRAFAYTIQWPLIGAFAVVVWNRYRKHGNLTKWFTERYRSRIEQFQREDARSGDSVAGSATVDPDEEAWKAYVQQLRAADPPGRPPNAP